MLLGSKNVHIYRWTTLPKERNCILRFGAKIPGTTSIALWYSQLLSNTVQSQRVRSDFYLRQPRLPLVTDGCMVAIGTDRYLKLQRVGGLWSPFIQIATDVGSRLGKDWIPTLRLFLNLQSKKISNDQELIQSDPISCPQNQKRNN